MAVFGLIHGGGGAAWDWHLVAPVLRARGHDVVAVDLPCADRSAGLSEYADAVVDALGGDRADSVLVAHSLGGFTAPIVCRRIPVRLLVLLAAMVPSPGERGADWWKNTGYDEAVGKDDYDDIERYYHDVPPELAALAAEHWRDQADTPMLEPWPLDAWPDVPTRYLLCRNDRLFPPEWTRGMVRDRLDLEPDELDGGHCVFLSRPKELAVRLVSYLT
jgi:pimeloyl-ACP methyl ester carboxylesterase